MVSDIFKEVEEESETYCNRLDLFSHQMSSLPTS